MSESMDSQVELAEFVSGLETEPIGAFLEMKLIELKPGYARVSMKMRREFLTFNNYIFGGIIMSLADQAFACATNSMGRPSIASQFNIHFVSAATPEDELMAEGRVLRKGRRVDICEISVTNKEGKLLAKATGTAIPMS